MNEVKIVNEVKTYEDAIFEFENFIRQLKKWNFDEASTFYRALTESPKEIVSNLNGVGCLEIPFEVKGKIYSPVIWIEKESFEELAGGFEFYKQAFDLEQKNKLMMRSIFTQHLFSATVAGACTIIEKYFKDAIITEFKSDIKKSKIEKDLSKIIDRYFG